MFFKYLLVTLALQLFISAAMRSVGRRFNPLRQGAVPAMGYGGATSIGTSYGNLGPQQATYSTGYNTGSYGDDLSSSGYRSQGSIASQASYTATEANKKALNSKMYEKNQAQQFSMTQPNEVELQLAYEYIDALTSGSYKDFTQVGGEIIANDEKKHVLKMAMNGFWERYSEEGRQYDIGAKEEDTLGMLWNRYNDDDFLSIVAINLFKRNAESLRKIFIFGLQHYTSQVELLFNEKASEEKVYRQQLVQIAKDFRHALQTGSKQDFLYGEWGNDDKERVLYMALIGYHENYVRLIANKEIADISQENENTIKGLLMMDKKRTGQFLTVVSANLFDGHGITNKPLAKIFDYALKHYVESVL